MSYLADVKSDLKGLFDEAFDHAWKEIVEPALKESYRNGVADGRKAASDEPKPATTPQRRRFGKQRAPQRQPGEE